MTETLIIAGSILIGCAAIARVLSAGLLLLASALEDVERAVINGSTSVVDLIDNQL